MSDENQTGGTATATPKKTKKPRAPQTFLLVGVVKDADGNIESFTRLPQPNVTSDTPRRDDIRRAVKKALEEGNEAAVKFYANKDLAVVSFPEPFRYDCAVEEVTVRKVKITEG